MSTEATDILIAARSVLARGWCPYVLFDSDGNHCALGALQVVHRHRRVEYYEALDRLEAACNRLYGPDPMGRPNRYGRTWDGRQWWWWFIEVNNEMGKDAILAAFDVAIGPDRLHETAHHADRQSKPVPVPAPA